MAQGARACKSHRLAYNPPSLKRTAQAKRACRSGSERACEPLKPLAKGDREMPKLKTKSGAKKRFRFTASGKIKHGQTRKRHGMIKRSNEQIRNLRGTRVLSDTETQRVKRWMPYAG